MANSAGELLEALEKASARLQALPPDDIEAIAAAMNERSAAILGLRELLAQSSGSLSAGDLRRLREALEANAAIARKLLLLRAACRAELGRLLEAAFLNRSLVQGAALRPPNLDYEG